MARAIATPVHQAVRDQMDRFSRRKIKDGPHVSSECHSQVYASGPVAWLVALHVGIQSSAFPAQVLVACDRATGRLRVTAEPRRDSRTKARLNASELTMAAAKVVLAKVELALETLDLLADPAYAPAPKPKPKTSRQLREEEAAQARLAAEPKSPDEDVLNLFSNDKE